MKVSKIFGCVLGLHACLIAVLVVQPGCQSTQPPTQTYTQEKTMKSSVKGASRSGDALIPAARAGEDSGLDPAFNAGFEDDQYAPRGAFSEFDSIEPLEPLNTGSGPTVDAAGSSMEMYTVKRGDSLWAISKRYDVSLDELYSANGLNKNSVLKVGQQIQVPQIPAEGGTATVNTVTPNSDPPNAMNQSGSQAMTAMTDYTVRRGDTLSKIANRYDTTVNAIQAANDKSTDMIRVGETLVIPVGGKATAGSGFSASTSSSSSAASSARATGTHVVRAGEYPATIARKYGMTTSELLAVNGITDPRKLQVGQRLKVSSSGSAANVDSRTDTRAAPARSNQSSSQSTASEGPVPITVIEADPLVEGELNPGDSTAPAVVEEPADDPFGDAVEIPVIRLEE